jgi:hypothetical protein
LKQEKYLYASDIEAFLNQETSQIIGILTTQTQFNLELTQSWAWSRQVEILKIVLEGLSGQILFEFSIPRMGRRIDVILVIRGVVFVLEFKVGEKEYLASAIDQVFDYALDLKNFHETSHNRLIAPILVATEAHEELIFVSPTHRNDLLLFPMKANSASLREAINRVLEFSDIEILDAIAWENGRYRPTPTIIEAALALYNKHAVKEITRNDAEAINLTETSSAISAVIDQAKTNKQKAICFLTGVPGAGKTLVGLDIATKNLDVDEKVPSVFLSGNGPLVSILQEALTRDRVKREKEKGNRVKKGEVLSEVKLFIQNVHHFRDDCLRNENEPPPEHVAIFDEAQRAWNQEQTEKFMREKKGRQSFVFSEPEFLISCLDRHKDWAVVVCLIGGGQEINKGEAGISEWISAINRSFPDWLVYVSDRLTDSEYAAGNAIELLSQHRFVSWEKSLHLSVSLRSYRAENLSLLVKNLLDINIEEARMNYLKLKDKYPILLTRSLPEAKAWLRKMARGSERYGLIVSSQAQRLKPHAIDVKSPMDPIHWFLDGKEDVRSSYYLEDVATEFHVQGLELDYACVTWDADFRFENDHWGTYSFVGDKWQNIHKADRKQYLKNAYRVLLTRARQGMAIVVPEGSMDDPTRKSSFYDGTWNYLKEIFDAKD